MLSAEHSKGGGVGEIVEETGGGGGERGEEAASLESRHTPCHGV